MSVICNNILPNIHTRRKSAEMTAFFLYCPFSYTSRAGAWMEWDVKMSPGFPAGTWTQCNPLALWYPTLILQNCTSLGRNKQLLLWSVCHEFRSLWKVTLFLNTWEFTWFAKCHLKSYCSWVPVTSACTCNLKVLLIQLVGQVCIKQAWVNITSPNYNWKASLR